MLYSLLVVYTCGANRTFVLIKPTRFLIKPTRLLMKPTRLLTKSTRFLINPTRFLIKPTKFLIKTTRLTNFPNFILLKPYMFRVSPLPITRSFLLYIRHWYISWNILTLLGSCHQTCKKCMRIIIRALSRRVTSAKAW